MPGIARVFAAVHDESPTLWKFSHAADRAGSTRPGIASNGRVAHSRAVMPRSWQGMFRPSPDMAAARGEGEGMMRFVPLSAECRRAVAMNVPGRVIHWRGLFHHLPNLDTL